jgi:pSer/pThr/pTyr-binding forkhead associated (FHA) protein
MPTAINLEIGRAAVKAKLITQQQFDECVEILTDLEKKGAQPEVLTILLQRGYLTAEQARKVPGPSEAMVARAVAAAGAPAAAPAKTSSPAPKPAAPLTDETASGVRSPTPLRTPKSGAKLSAYSFINLTGNGQFEIFFLPEKPVAIGRDVANDIVVDDEPVSKRHARLTFANSEMTLWDVGSMNGTFVNGERITNRKLQPGDVVSVGKGRLIFVKGVKPDGALTSPLAPSAGEAGAAAAFAGKAGFKPGERIFLGKSPLFIGRDKNNNVVLDDPTVSSFHIQIAKMPEGVKIQDLNSASGVLVNGEKIAMAQLEPDDTITFGKFSLFCEQVLGKRGTGAPKAAAAKKDLSATIATSAEALEGAAKPSGLGKALLEELEDKVVHPVSAPTEGMPPSARPAAMPKQPTPPPPSRVPRTLRLLCLAGPVKDKTYRLGKRALSVGRDPSSDIFLDELSVSRSHARIRPLEGGGVEIVDLNSRNGVEINGKKVKAQRLSPGDKVALGKCLFVVEAE